MKKILESFDAVEGSYPVPQPDKVRMNVSLNAEGKDGIEDLLDIMKAAGAHDAKAVSPDMMPMVKPAQNDDMRKMLAAMDSPEMEDDVEEEEYVNSPDEEYQDTAYMAKDLSGGVNREKKSYKPTNGGDNPMALEQTIKEQLLQALEEKKKSPAGGPACWDGKKIHPTKPTKMKDGKRVNNCIDADGSDGK